jgi:hypothetical protein
MATPRSYLSVRQGHSYDDSSLERNGVGSKKVYEPASSVENPPHNRNNNENIRRRYEPTEINAGLTGKYNERNQGGVAGRGASSNIDSPPVGSKSLRNDHSNEVDISKEQDSHISSDLTIKKVSTGPRALGPLGSELYNDLVAQQTRLSPKCLTEINGVEMDVGEIQLEEEASFLKEELVQKLFKTVKRYFQLDTDDSDETVRALIVEAISYSDTNYGIAEAVEWGTGLAWDKKKIASDLSLLKDVNWNFAEVARIKLAAKAGDRLSVERVMALRPDNHEIERLLSPEEGRLVTR